MKSHGEGAHEQPKGPPAREDATNVTARRRRFGVGDVVVALTGHARDGTAQRMPTHPEGIRDLAVPNAAGRAVPVASDTAEVGRRRRETSLDSMLNELASVCARWPNAA